MAGNLLPLNYFSLAIRIDCRLKNTQNHVNYMYLAGGRGLEREEGTPT